jgi:aerobic-type carbon monoxide dehydrogenase small subunit (CoxS/CutS family)
MTAHVSITVNGTRYEREVDPRLALVDLLRDELGLNGTHIGCEQGVCGSCTVLVGGTSVLSCLMLAVQADGQQVSTVESLADGPTLHPLQEAFWEKQGLQCGFCTPGMLMRAKEILANDPAPTSASVREAIAGNLCRCTGYQFIVESILEAADRMAAPADASAAANGSAAGTSSAASAGSASSQV